MRLNTDIFGNHELALMARARRAGVLAANLANADTPNYKARDIDFGNALEGAGTQGDLALATTVAAHLGDTANAPAGGDLKYRIPFQPSLDGNTVETPVEMAAFSENAVRYQASLMFINRTITTIETALTGQ
ncbi:MAG TPA: flagellar basal body rod protein FlgB [Steroidobacteraceae bacterium]|nr:flagellar basal body rod protein FlgB [Steroidobacteraceae bacterium]